MTQYFFPIGAEGIGIPEGEAPDYSQRRQALQHLSQLERRDQNLRLWCLWPAYRQYGQHLCRDQKLHVSKCSKILNVQWGCKVSVCPHHP